MHIILAFLHDAYDLVLILKKAVLEWARYDLRTPLFKRYQREIYNLSRNRAKKPLQSRSLKSYTLNARSSKYNNCYYLNVKLDAYEVL